LHVSITANSNYFEKVARQSKTGIIDRQIMAFLPHQPLQFKKIVIFANLQFNLPAKYLKP